MFDPKMRGQDNQWVRPHPGPFVWSMIEPKENDYFWNDADGRKYHKANFEKLPDG